MPVQRVNENGLFPLQLDLQLWSIWDVADALEAPDLMDHSHYLRIFVDQAADFITFQNANAKLFLALGKAQPTRMFETTILGALFVIRHFLLQFKLLHGLDQVAARLPILLLLLNRFGRHRPLLAKTGEVPMFPTDLDKAFRLADRHHVVESPPLLHGAAFLALIGEDCGADAQL